MRRWVATRPLLGSALAGLIAFALFAGINLAAGEGAFDSLIGGLFVGAAVGGGLALRAVMSRRRVE